MLIVLSEGQRIAEVDVKPDLPVLLGSGRGVELLVPGEGIAERHMEITLGADGKLAFRYLATTSASATALRTSSHESRRFILAPPCTLKLGKMQLTFEVHASAAPAALATQSAHSSWAQPPGTPPPLGGSGRTPAPPLPPAAPPRTSAPAPSKGGGLGLVLGALAVAMLLFAGGSWMIYQRVIKPRLTGSGTTKVAPPADQPPKAPTTPPSKEVVLTPPAQPPVKPVEPPKKDVTSAPPADKPVTKPMVTPPPQPPPRPPEPPKPDKHELFATGLRQASKIVVSGSALDGMKELVKLEPVSPTEKEMLQEELDMAARKLSAAFRDGEGRDRMTEIAATLDKASDFGSIDAKTMLGLMYSNGHGVAKDLEKAFKLFEYAASSGNAEALYYEGECHFFGKGTAVNYDKAASCFEQALQREQWRAADQLGVIYRKGLIGGMPNYQAALKYFHAASEKNIASATFNLGVMYMNGEGIERDQMRGAQMFKKAAEAGWPPAMEGYAQCLMHGIGVPEDPKEAAIWLNRAQRKSN